MLKVIQVLEDRRLCTYDSEFKHSSVGQERQVKRVLILPRTYQTHARAI
jgi:hypothetical protein